MTILRRIRRRVKPARPRPLPRRIRRPLATPADQAVAVAAFLAGREPPPISGSAPEPWEDDWPRTMTPEEQARAMWEAARFYREMQEKRR